MRILGVFHRNRLAPVLFMLGLLGFASGCGDTGPAGGAGPTPETKAKDDAEREARQKAYGDKGIPPTTKKDADAAAKN
jgi:hypothetical protein